MELHGLTEVAFKE